MITISYSSEYSAGFRASSSASRRIEIELRHGWFIYQTNINVKGRAGENAFGVSQIAYAWVQRGLAAGAASAFAADGPASKLVQIVPTISPQPGMKVPPESERRAYLMVYFKDETHSIYFAASDRINRGYVYEAGNVDPETVAAEAPNLWWRHGSGTCVLMYDVFGAKPHTMGFSETTDFIHYKNLGRFNEPGSPMKSVNFSGPKHGAVMAITLDEMKRLRAYFENPKP